MLEEIALHLDDFARDALDGLLALLDGGCGSEAGRVEWGEVDFAGEAADEAGERAGGSGGEKDAVAEVSGSEIVAG